MYEVKHNKIPQSLQLMFTQRESNYNFRGTCMFNRPYVRTTLRQHCLSSKGVKLWNTFSDDLKEATSVFQFKSIFKRIIQKKYLTE